MPAPKESESFAAFVANASRRVKEVKEVVGEENEIDLGGFSMLFVKDCVDSTFVFSGKIDKVIVEHCENCTFHFNCKVLSGTVEIINVTKSVCHFSTDIPSTTVDGSKEVRIDMDAWPSSQTRAAIYTSKTQNSSLVVRAEAVEMGIPDSLDGQWVTWMVEGKLMSEAVVRCGGGYVTTAREKQAADAKEDRAMATLQESMANSLHISPASGVQQQQPAEPFVAHPAPVDDDGFVLAFSVTDADKIRDFFDDYGFVVVRDALSAEETQSTVEEIWSLFPDADPNDARTWESDTMNIGSVGIVGTTVCSGRRAFENRQNANVHAAFAALLGTDHLYSSFDRYGCMKPVRDIRMPQDGGEIHLVDRPDWQTRSAWIHWDLNPWNWTGNEDPSLKVHKSDDQLYREEIDGWSDPLIAHSQFISENNDRVRRHYTGVEKLQGLVALSDSRVQDGGFLTVPGFHKYLSTWAAKTKQYNTAMFVMAPPDDNDIVPHIQRISMRAGSLCIWSSQMPHCNYPSESERFRFCQYIKMFPVSVFPDHPLREESVGLRAKRLQELFPESFQPSDLGRRLFGLAPWE